MCAYDGWACSIKVHAFKWEVLHLVREFFSLNFELAIKTKVITRWIACLFCHMEISPVKKSPFGKCFLKNFQHIWTSCLFCSILKTSFLTIQSNFQNLLPFDTNSYLRSTSFGAKFCQNAENRKGVFCHNFLFFWKNHQNSPQKKTFFPTLRFWFQFGSI
jgi:hypothetical protein